VTCRRQGRTQAQPQPDGNKAMALICRKMVYAAVQPSGAQPGARPAKIVWAHPAGRAHGGGHAVTQELGAFAHGARLGLQRPSHALVPGRSTHKSAPCAARFAQACASFMPVSKLRCYAALTAKGRSVGSCVRGG
jgi:hypothetical protein